MSLSSFFQRFRRPARPGATPKADRPPPSPSEIEAARVRARRRLVGMVVLVGAGVIGFPWLFETQPRPMASDVEVLQAPAAGASRDDGPPVRVAAGKVGVAGIVPPVSAIEDDDDDTPPASASASARPAAPTTPGVRPEAKVTPKVTEPARASAPHSVLKEPVKEPPKPAPRSPKESPATSPAGSTGTAKAAVDKTGGQGADQANVRYVVQFGAFADVAAAHAARMKVERLGIKTYTQQIDTPAGKRIRVRMGPYADRAEAEKVLASMRKAGLDGAVLTL